MVAENGCYINIRMYSDVYENRACFGKIPKNLFSTYQFANCPQSFNLFLIFCYTVEVKIDDKNRPPSFYCPHVPYVDCGLRDDFITSNVYI